MPTVSIGEAGSFDFDGDGFAEASGWVGPSDGLVARDLDSNGSIDTGRELFGDQTLLPDGIGPINAFFCPKPRKGKAVFTYFR